MRSSVSSSSFPPRPPRHHLAPISHVSLQKEGAEMKRMSCLVPVFEREAQLVFVIAGVLLVCSRMSVIFLQYESMIRPYFARIREWGDGILAHSRTLSTRKTLVVKLFEEEVLVLRGPDWRVDSEVQ